MEIPVSYRKEKETLQDENLYSPKTVDTQEKQRQIVYYSFLWKFLLRKSVRSSKKRFCVLWFKMMVNAHLGIRFYKFAKWKQQDKSISI